MSWKKITLELVPPLSEEQQAREPWTRKEKFKAAADKAAQIFHQIARRMGFNDLHDTDEYVMMHLSQDHLEIAQRNITVRKDGRTIIKNKIAARAEHKEAHRIAKEEAKTRKVIPINSHEHDADKSFYLEPIWNEYADARRALLEITGQIPKEPK